MREINVTVYCDACIAQGETPAPIEESKAVAVKLDLGGAKREMDVCDSCAADFFNMSRRDTTAKAQPKTKKSKAGIAWVYTQDYGFDSGEELEWICNHCDAHSATEQGIKQHLSRTHKDRAPA